MGKKLPQSIRKSKSRAAGLAASTAGRARTFSVTRWRDDSADEIEEAMEDRVNAKIQATCDALKKMLLPVKKKTVSLRSNPVFEKTIGHFRLIDPAGDNFPDVTGSVKVNGGFLEIVLDGFGTPDTLNGPVVSIDLHDKHLQTVVSPDINDQNNVVTTSLDSAKEKLRSLYGR